MQYKNNLASLLKKALVGLTVGALFIYLTLRQIDIENSIQYIRNANIYWIILPALFYFSIFILRAWRWQMLLSHVKKIELFKLFKLLFIGFLMNILLPFRIGELVRANLTGKKTAVPRTGVLASIVSERVFDGVIIVLLFCITMFSMPIPQWAIKSLYAGSSAFIAGIVILFVIARKKEVAVKIFSKLPIHLKFVEKLEDLFIKFINSLEIFSSISLIVKVFSISLVIWIMEGLVFYMITNAFNIHLGLMQCFLVIIIIGMGAALPTAPGGIGTFEFLGVLVLSFLGIDKNIAFGYLLTIHFIQLTTLVSCGIVSLIAEKVTLGELIKV